MTTSVKKKPAGKADQVRRMADAIVPDVSTSIVPANTVSGRSLLTVVAIMTFLAAITVGAIAIVREAALHWRTDLGREITIQVRAREGSDTAAETAKVVSLANKISGLREVRILNAEETGALLSPWLGQNTELGALPVPGLVVATIDEKTPPNLGLLAATLKQEVPAASLDDHRSWASRLASVSDAVLIGGGTILALVLAATTLSVALATRSAVASNRVIVEVLHFVGARDSYIASVFQRHFLLAAAKGALAGGIAAAAVFALAAFAPDLLAMVQAPGNAGALFGQMILPPAGYAAIAGIVVAVVMVATVAARITVFRTIRSID